MGNLEGMTVVIRERLNKRQARVSEMWETASVISPNQSQEKQTESSSALLASVRSWPSQKCQWRFDLSACSPHSSAEGATPLLFKC